MARRGTRRIERSLLGVHADVTHWFLGCPEHRLLERAGRSDYEEMTAPVSPACVMKFDQDVLRAVGAEWTLPLVSRMAAGADLDLEPVLDARSSVGLEDAPVVDTMEWPAG